eukprot:XP_020400980.1 dermokine-like [Zea mays]
MSLRIRSECRAWATGYDDGSTGGELDVDEGSGRAAHVGRAGSPWPAIGGVHEAGSRGLAAPNGCAATLASLGRRAGLAASCREQGLGKGRGEGGARKSPPSPPSEDFGDSEYPEEASSKYDRSLTPAYARSIERAGLGGSGDSEEAPSKEVEDSSNSKEGSDSEGGGNDDEGNNGGDDDSSRVGDGSGDDGGDGSDDGDGGEGSSRGSNGGNKGGDGNAGGIVLSA